MRAASPSSWRRSLLAAAGWRRRRASSIRRSRELEAELVCPSCHEPLDESNSPIAQQMKAVHPRAHRARAGRRSRSSTRWSRSSARRLGVAADARLRPARVGAAARRDRGSAPLALGGGAWHWSRARRRPVARPAGAGARRRRANGASTTSSHASMAEKLPVAFLAGLLSVITPCVLPLVPGYLSAVSAVEVDRLGERGVGAADRARERAVHRSGSRPSSSLLGAGAAAIGERRRRSRRRSRSPASCSSCSGSRSSALLPWPERAVAPGLLQRARRTRLARAARRSVRRLCGAVHRHGARVDPRARGSSGTIARGVVLLVAYSLGLGAAFVARRDRVRARDDARSAGCATTTASCACVSGATLVALGLLLFFHRDWWLRVALDQVLTQIGLGSL